MYDGVPKNSPALVSCAAGTLAIPKSMIFGCPLGQHHDVGGLHVAVDDVLLVGMLEGLGHVRGDAQGLAPLEAAVALHALGEGLALQVLERDVEGVAARVAADVVDDDDAGVGEAGGDPRLVQEALLEARAVLVGDREERGARS